MNLARLNQLVDEEVALNSVRERHPAAMAVETCLKSDRKDVCRLLMDVAKEGIGGINTQAYAKSVERVRDNLPYDGTDLRARMTRLMCGLERGSREMIAELVLDVWTTVTGAPVCSTSVQDLALLLRPSLTKAEQVCALGQPTQLDSTMYRVCDAGRDPSYTAMVTGELAADYRGRVLDNADLSGLALPESLFDEASLRGADFTQSNLQQANFRGADLRGAKFIDADLDSARLRYTDLRGADFTGANVISATFKGSDLRGAKGLDLGWWTEYTASTKGRPKFTPWDPDPYE